MKFACRLVAVLLTIALDAASASESSARYAVATANAAATDAGMRMLAMGGSAADAAVAIQMDLTEGNDGQILNNMTGKPFDFASDPCVEQGLTFAYDEPATTATVAAVKAFLTAALK